MGVLLTRAVGLGSVRSPLWGSPAHPSRLRLTDFQCGQAGRQGRRHVKLRIPKDGHKRSEIPGLAQLCGLCSFRLHATQGFAVRRPR
jgi:hypothetical protein